MRVDLKPQVHRVAAWYGKMLEPEPQNLTLFLELLGRPGAGTVENLGTLFIVLFIRKSSSVYTALTGLTKRVTSPPI